MIPKIIISLTKSGETAIMYTDVIKIKKQSKVSLIKRIKLNDFDELYIGVNYGQRVMNEMYCKNYKDFEWGIEAFSDKSLWIS